MKAMHWLIGVMSLAGLAVACGPIQPPVSNPSLTASPTVVQSSIAPGDTRPASTPALIQPSASPPFLPTLVPIATLPGETQPAASPTPAEATASAIPISPAKALVSFSGAASAVSDAFHLPVAGAVEVSWQYTGRGHFAVWLVNVSEALADPAYDRQLVVDTDDDTVGAAGFQLIAGDYTLEVEEAAGPWVIAVEPRP
jgi:hypothetical protein